MRSQILPELTKPSSLITKHIIRLDLGLCITLTLNIKLHQVKNQGAQVFRGVVHSITEFGAFISMDVDWKVQGLVHI